MLNYLIKVLLTTLLITGGFPKSDVFCSTKELSWNNAIQTCLNAHGSPMSFHGSTGQKIEQINLRPDVTVWTSEYLYQVNDYQGGSCLCSFRYLTEDNLYQTSDELFSTCDKFRLFFCENETNHDIQVLNNTWDNTNGCGSFSQYNQLKSVLKPGYYWTDKTNKCGLVGLVPYPIQNKWNIDPILCGAYSKGAGRHFRICETQHRHVCVSSGENLPSNDFDYSCFLAESTGTSELSKATTPTPVFSSYQPQSTEPSWNVTAPFIEAVSTTNLLPTVSFNISTVDYVYPESYPTKISKTSTKTTQNISDTHVVINDTIEHARESLHKQEETNTDAGTIAGIIVGVCLALVGVAVLLIFIRKRYRRLVDRRTTDSKLKTKSRISNLSKTPKSRTLFNNLAYDSWEENHKEKRENQLKQSHTEIPSMKQFRSESERVHYNCSSSENVNDIIQPQTTETSADNFSKETAGDSGEDDMQTPETSQNEYDTTRPSRKGVYETENLYNTTDALNKSYSLYDTTLRQGQSFETVGVYNKLATDNVYGKFGTTLSNNEDYDSVTLSSYQQTT